MLTLTAGDGTPADQAETRCDAALPISMSVVPLDKPEAGRSIRLEVTVDSGLDPDLVRSARLEYDLPPGFRHTVAMTERHDVPLRKGLTRRQMGVRVPDESRHEVRARLVIDLAGGRTISQTASCWIDAGAPDPPAGMIGRIQDRDGSAIVVYQGVTVRGRR